MLLCFILRIRKGDKITVLLFYPSRCDRSIPTECGFPADNTRSRDSHAPLHAAYRDRRTARALPPSLLAQGVISASHPLLGGVPRSGGVGFLVVTCPEPTPAFGHPSREGIKKLFFPSPLGAQASCLLLLPSPPWRGAAKRRGGSAGRALQEPTPALRATPPERG